MGDDTYLEKAELPTKFGANKDKNDAIDLSPSKMALINRDNLSDQLVFHYNPTTWSDTRGTEYKSEKVSEWGTDRPQYDRTGKRTITMTLFFDDTTLRSNLFAESGGYRGATPLTHGQFTTKEDKYGNYVRKLPPGGLLREAPAVTPGKRVGVAGQKTTQASINWLREHSMTINERWEAPPVLIFSGLKRHYSLRLFACVLTQVDIHPLAMKPNNPWLVRRANVDITLDEFWESTI